MNRTTRERIVNAALVVPLVVFTARGTVPNVLDISSSQEAQFNCSWDKNPDGTFSRVSDFGRRGSVCAPAGYYPCSVGFCSVEIPGNVSVGEEMQMRVKYEKCQVGGCFRGIVEDPTSQ